MTEKIQYDGKSLLIEYNDADNFSQIPYSEINQHYGVCFLDGKIVIGWHGKKEKWSLLGGKVEPNEDITSTLIREVQEESNMRILKHKPIGYQKVTQEDGGYVYQLRSCCIVEPIGNFVNDPSESVTKIALISPEQWNEFIDWGMVGEHILERALKIKQQME